MTRPVAPEREEVRRFWDQRPCGSRHAEAQEGTPQYFEQVARRRDELEPYIARYADFAATRERRVLEIGVGLGSDCVRFARAGADVVGIDLTPHAIELVGRRLAHEGLDADLRVADAEALPFPDGHFDVVYSWGVLHHSPDPPSAIREAIRVLRPGGRLCIMLYARRSWVALGLWARYGLARGRPDRSLRWILAHHLESPGTRGYTPNELRRLFAGIDRLTIDREGTHTDRRVAGPLVGPTAARLGFYLVVRGVRAPRPQP